MEYVTSIRVRAEPARVYDLIESHFQSLGWNLEIGNKPRELIMNRGTGWGTFASHDIKRVKLKLNISIHDTDGETTAKFQYLGSSTRGYYTEQEKNDLNAEVNALKNMISATAPTPITQSSGLTCPSCQKQVSPDFAVCPYCSASLKTSNTCSGCNKELQPDFAACPYCGQPR